MSKMIVAEVSKSWERDNERRPPGTGKLLSEKFEAVISHNAERGYVLHSWKMTACAPISGLLTETIVAVFRLKEEQA
jgi:hypothetical protein